MVTKYLSKAKLTKGVDIITFWWDMYDKTVDINWLGTSRTNEIE